MTTFDSHGRLANRTSLLLLGWNPGTKISVTISSWTLILRPSSTGKLKINGQGFLVIPANSRTLLKLNGAGHFLLAAYPKQDLLCGWSLPMIDSMVASLLPPEIAEMIEA